MVALMGKEGPHTRGLEMKKDGEPHRRCCPVWSVFPKSHILNWPERQSPSDTPPLQRGKGHPPACIPQRGPHSLSCSGLKRAGHLGGRPACSHNGGDPGIVELSEVACLHGKVAGFPGDPLAASFSNHSLHTCGQGKGWSTPFMNRPWQPACGLLILIMISNIYLACVS